MYIVSEGVIYEGLYRGYYIMEQLCRVSKFMIPEESYYTGY